MEAFEKCRCLNMTLVTIRSEEENSAIFHAARNRNYEFWIGGYDYEKEGEFRWIGSGEIFSYTNWGPYEPTIRGRKENCVFLSKLATWRNLECEKKIYHGFICEVVNPWTGVDSL